MSGIIAIPKEMRTEIVREITHLLKNECICWPKQIYVTPRIIVHGVYASPDQYPILSKKKKCTTVRMISAYLKEQGRVLRTPGSNGRCCWMLPQYQVSGESG